MRNKRILITGSNGFVGKYLTSYLAQEYNNIYPAEREHCNLSKKDDVYQLLVNEISPDVIIHLAASSTPNTPLSEYDSFINNNIVATHNIVNAASRIGRKCRIIFASSIVVYGDKLQQGVLHELDRTFPKSMYAVSKLACENILNTYAREVDNIEIINLRFCAIVGPNMTHGCIHDFIKKCKNNTEPEFTVLGNEPGSIKPYLYISDAASAIKKSIEYNGFTGNYKDLTCNICPEDNISIKEIAGRVKDHFCDYRPLRWLGKNIAGDNPFIQACNARAKETLRWTPDFNMDSKEAVQIAIGDNP